MCVMCAIRGTHTSPGKGSSSLQKMATQRLGMVHKRQPGRPGRKQLRAAAPVATHPATQPRHRIGPFHGPWQDAPPAILLLLGAHAVPHGRHVPGEWGREVERVGSGMQKAGMDGHRQAGDRGQLHRPERGLPQVEALSACHGRKEALTTAAR